MYTKPETKPLKYFVPMYKKFIIRGLKISKIYLKYIISILGTYIIKKYYLFQYVDVKFSGRAYLLIVLLSTTALYKLQWYCLQKKKLIIAKNGINLH